MKSKMITLAVALLFGQMSVCISEADVVDYLMGYNQGYSQTYTYVTDEPYPQYYPASQSSGAPKSYTINSVPQQGQPAIPQPQVAPRQPVQFTQKNSGAQSQTKAGPKNKSTQIASAANGVRPTKKQIANPAAKRPQRTVSSNYPAQSPAGLQGGYGQPAQTAYNRGYYQNQPPAPRNYYQGYSRNVWGSAGQACPPGRA
ncbi:MAG: hypothetical protein HY912_21860 [Desulfomonile tiedjei]|uniref:Translation initiation factor IF-2 n=1 Tax=Desulfomonile tiedjei TaxID=2358 RepID=A0A9D6Z5M6_9BACT|nr:hypothetical protein [Desulfomonile tiedjei]